MLRILFEDRKRPKAVDVCRSLEALLGENTVYCCSVRNESCFEVTLSDDQLLKNVDDTVYIDGEWYTARPLVNDKIVVSFMNLPSYTTDKEIRDKLAQYGITEVGEIHRRKIKGTNWEDGTRYARVKFPPGVSSLPYTMKFYTHEGHEFFKVIHNKQTKVCFHCLSDQHEKWQCPQIQCQNCGFYGHIQYNCDVPPCHRCDKKPKLCRCYGYEDDNNNMENLDDMFPSLRRPNREVQSLVTPEKNPESTDNTEEEDQDVAIESDDDSGEDLDEEVVGTMNDLLDKVCETMENDKKPTKNTEHPSVSVRKTSLKAKVKRKKWKVLKPNEDVVKAHIGGRAPKNLQGRKVLKKK